MDAPVLVIDDNSDVRVLTARILRHLGEEAVCVAGGREALEYLCATSGRRWCCST